MEAGSARTAAGGGARAVRRAGLRRHDRRGDRATAGLTERTFFRHFADKREVLFAGQDELERPSSRHRRAPDDTAPARWRSSRRRSRARPRSSPTSAARGPGHGRASSTRPGPAGTRAAQALGARRRHDATGCGDAASTRRRRPGRGVRRRGLPGGLRDVDRRGRGAPARRDPAVGAAELRRCRVPWPTTGSSRGAGPRPGSGRRRPSPDTARGSARGRRRSGRCARASGVTVATTGSRCGRRRRPRRPPASRASPSARRSRRRGRAAPPGHVADDLRPQPAAGAAADGDEAPVRARRRRDRLEVVPHAVGGALQRGAVEVGRGRGAASARDHAARVGVEERRALAGEVGQHEQPVGARRAAPASASSVSYVGRRRGRATRR